nr:Rid family detoxifying hydrolase [uncultured Schaedlerella sp.]
MKKELISTDRAAQPGGWYSQGVQVGDFVFTAGITGTDPETGKLVGPDDIQAQTHQIMKNMKAILEAAGTDLEHVFKTLVFVADIDQFSIFNETYKQYFPENPPARSTMQVGKFNGGMAIEIEAIAVIEK